MKKLLFYYGVYCFCLKTAQLFDAEYVNKMRQYTKKLIAAYAGE